MHGLEKLDNYIPIQTTEKSTKAVRKNLPEQEGHKAL
jgi:hypothetical protein